MTLLERIKSTLGKAKNWIVDKAKTARQNAREAAGSARDKTSDATSAAGDKLSDLREKMQNMRGDMKAKAADKIPYQKIIPAKPMQDVRMLLFGLEYADAKAKGKGALRIVAGAYTGTCALAGGVMWYYGRNAIKGIGSRLKGAATSITAGGILWGLTKPIRLGVGFGSGALASAAVSVTGVGALSIPVYFAAKTTGYYAAYHTCAWSIEWMYELMDGTSLQATISDFINVGRHSESDTTTERSNATHQTQQQDIIDIDYEAVQ